MQQKNSKLPNVITNVRRQSEISESSTVVTSHQSPRKIKTEQLIDLGWSENEPALKKPPGKRKSSLSERLQESMSLSLFDNDLSLLVSESEEN